MSVQYNVSSLLKEPVGSMREYAVDDRVLIDPETPTHQHIVGNTTFLRTTDGVLVTARLEGAQPERCSRCLREIAVRVRMAIAEEFLASGEAQKPPEDLVAFRIDEHHTLDMEDVVRQHWAAALPMQPLCRLDCRGLCPRCGVDRNQGVCPCPPEEDDRWSALRELAMKNEGS